MNCKQESRVEKERNEEGRLKPSRESPLFIRGKRS